MNNEIEPIQFRFVNIIILSKSLTEPKEGKIEFNFIINVDAKVQADLGLVLMNVSVVINNIETTDYLADFRICCVFEIIDFQKHIKLNDEGLYIIPPHLDNVIKPVSISTTRGIIYSDLRGTYLQNAIMPVVYMTDFIQKVTDDNNEKA